MENLEKHKYMLTNIKMIMKFKNTGFWRWSFSLNVLNIQILFPNHEVIKNYPLVQCPVLEKSQENCNHMLYLSIAIWSMGDSNKDNQKILNYQSKIRIFQTIWVILRISSYVIYLVLDTMLSFLVVFFNMLFIIHFLNEFQENGFELLEKGKNQKSTTSTLIS